MPPVKMRHTMQSTPNHSLSRIQIIVSLSCFVVVLSHLQAPGGARNCGVQPLEWRARHSAGPDAEPGENSRNDGLAPVLHQKSFFMPPMTSPSITLPPFCCLEMCS